MGLEIILLLGVLGLGAVGAVTAVGMIMARRVEDHGRTNLRATVERGALPPSLHPKIDEALCIGSGACVDSCPEEDVIAVLDGKARVVNPTVCIGHGECMAACPVSAIQLVLGSERRGIDIPLIKGDFETNVPGVFVVGELGGMGLVYNAMTQGLQCVRGIARKPSPKGPGVLQVLVVGAGPAGIAAGLDYAVVDQESVGGTVLHYPRHKIVMTRPVDLPLYGTVRVSEVKKEDLLGIWQDILQKTGLVVQTGVRVDGMKRADDGIFDVQTSAGLMRAHRVVLAVGRRGSPRKLGVPGEDTGKVIYRLLEPEKYTGRRCLVVGGGDAAVEAAMALGESGATVHLAHRGKVFDRIKPKNQANLDKAVAAKTVTLLMDSQSQEITPEIVKIKVGGEVRELPNDDVLVFVGGVLPSAFLQAAGVEIKTFKGEAFAPANR